MIRLLRFVGTFSFCVLSLAGIPLFAGAADTPDFTTFGFPTVAASMAINADQAVTIAAGDQSVAIKAGTFDRPVTFDLLISAPSAWQDRVGDRTVRAAFAFRVTDTATKEMLGTFKQPVVYTYGGTDARSTDAILNTTAASPPVITPNTTPITFDGKVSHPFGGSGGGWLLVSAPAGGASSATTTTNLIAAQRERTRTLLPVLLLVLTLGGAVIAAIAVVRKSASP